MQSGAQTRKPAMQRIDRRAFLATALGVLTVNAAMAVGIGCSLYLLRVIRSAQPLDSSPSSSVSSPVKQAKEQVLLRAGTWSYSNIPPK